MKTAKALLLLLPATTITANAALLEDLTSLKESIASATNTMIEFQNDTGPVNTASMIQSIGWQVGASMANMGCDNKSLPKINATNDNAFNSDQIEGAYSNYTISLTHLSTALEARGRLPHGESDTLVVQQTQSLTRTLYLFAKCLYNGEYITSSGAIDTWNAEGDLQQATSEWEEQKTVAMKAREEKVLRKKSVGSLKKREQK